MFKCLLSQFGTLFKINDIDWGCPLKLCPCSLTYLFSMSVKLNLQNSFPTKHVRISVHEVIPGMLMKERGGGNHTILLLLWGLFLNHLEIQILFEVCFKLNSLDLYFCSKMLRKSEGL